MQVVADLDQTKNKEDEDHKLHCFRYSNPSLLKKTANYSRIKCDASNFLYRSEQSLSVNTIKRHKQAS